MLIHADVLKYSPPVLANVVPDQSSIPPALARWLANLERVRACSNPPRVVVVAVGDEELTVHDWEPLDSPTACIRNHRKRLVMDALTRYGARPIMEEVKDYSYRRALAVFQRHPDADGFVCLSDALAVAVQQHFIVAGQPWEGRVLGFDNTLVAHEEGVSSFEQSRAESARLAIDALRRFFEQQVSPPAEDDWPEPQMAKVKVSLALRPKPRRS